MWARILDMKAADLGMLVFFGVGIFFFATWMQIRIVRKLGPTLHSTFQPMRSAESDILPFAGGF